MNIFYSQKLAVNSFEGATIGNFFGKDKGLVCFNKNHIKCYLLNEDGTLLLLFSDYLCENIIQIERYEIHNGHDGLVVCFESSKISLISFKQYVPIVESLKYFEKEEFDIRPQDKKIIRVSKHLGMSKISKYYFSIFSLSEKHVKTKVFKFINIDDKIKNVIDFIFLDNYNSPTICLIYNPIQCSYIHKKEVQAIIFSYDIILGKFNILEEFRVPQDTHKILFSHFTMAFIAHNDIVFRTSNSYFPIGLNKMSLNKERKSLDIVLNNEYLFFYNDMLIIINGDGCVYTIIIKLDSKRVIDVDIKSVCKLVTPRFISNHEDLLFIGSNEPSILCRLTNESSNCINEQPDMNVLDDDLEEVEYRSIYYRKTNSFETSQIKLLILDVFYGLGTVNDLFIRDPCEFLVASEGVSNSIQAIHRTLKLKECTKGIQCTGFESLLSLPGRIFITGEDKTTEINSNLDIVTDSFFNVTSRTLFFHSFEDSVYQITESCVFIYHGKDKTKFEFQKTIKKAECTTISGELIIVCLDVDNVLNIYDRKMSKIDQITAVSSFSLLDSYCYCVINNILCVYCLAKNEFVYSIRNITNFEDKYTKSPIFRENDELQSENLQAIKVVKLGGCIYVFVINCFGECFVYVEYHDSFLKVDTSDRFLRFNLDKEVIILQCGDIIFLNTVNPVSLYIKRNEAFFYDIDFDVRSLAVLNNRLYIIRNDSLFSCLYPLDHSTILFSDKELILDDRQSTIKQKTVDKDIKRLIQDSYCATIFDKYIITRYPTIRTPKNIVCVENYHVVASCEREVYKADASVDQGLDVETYRYYIDLYSRDFRLITSYQLESDEYVFDMKYLSLNDSIGKGGKSNFLVVSTTKIEGEDKQSRGRLIAFEITSIVADKENAYKDRKLKLFAAENIKGCITRCDEMKGNIAVCLGIKLMVYKIDRSEGLIPIAIHDLYTLSTSITTIKNYLLVSDIYRGLSFYYYQKKPIRLNLLCTSDPIRGAMSVDFIISCTEISFVCSDANGNLHVYSYTPNNIMSEGGTKMIKRYYIKSYLGQLTKKTSHSKFDNPIFFSESNFFVSLSGISSKIYIMLFKIQSQILSTLRHTFGLNPQNYLGITDHVSPLSLKKPIVRVLIAKFLQMNIDKRKELIKNSEISEKDFYAFLTTHFNKTH